jgi:two-component system OmpR family response regulator
VMIAESESAGTEADDPCRRVLLVEDDPDVRFTIGAMLGRAGFEVVEAASLREADFALAQVDFAVALVDINLNGEDGLSLVRRLAGSPRTSVLIVTGDSDPVDRILGIELGADDYITKPFNARELLARVRRRAEMVRFLRSAAPAQRKTRHLKVREWLLDVEQRCAVDEDGVSAGLTDAEFRTLVVLAENRGRSLTRGEIYAAVTGRDMKDALDRYVDNQVAALRKKLRAPGNLAVRTVHGVGYTLD